MSRYRDHEMFETARALEDSVGFAFHEQGPFVHDFVGKTGLTLADLIIHIRSIAAVKALDAAYSGSHNDNSARDLMFRLKAFVAGYSKDFDIWEDEIEELKIGKDPEYQEYLRLKDKFEK